MDWNDLSHFLRNLGVEWSTERKDFHTPPEEPLITVLQRSAEHEALYRVDWFQRGPEVLILLPSNQTPLRFDFYLVTLSGAHPLFGVLSQWLQYRGSEGFEQRREVAEWHLLHAVVESMKTLFWIGQATCQFPAEIIVQKMG